VKRSAHVAAFLLVSTALPAASQTIEVGRNVQVSRQHPADTHYEVLVAADPNDASRMIVGSFRYPDGTTNSATVVYATRDGGNTWVPTLQGAQLDNTSDPAPAFGIDGTAYYTASSLGPAGTPRDQRKMLLYRSSDGGLKWNELPSFTYSDRQYITVDHTSGKYRGRIYVNGNNRVPFGISDFVVFRSSDKGQTWQGPGTRPDFGKHSASSMGNAVIASDGTLIGIFEENDDMRSVRSLDGGESLTAAVDVDTAHVEPGNRKGTNNNVTGLPIIAIDPGNGPYKDRVYAVWADRRSGHSRIFLTYSSDKGLTWAKSVPIDSAPESDTTDNFMPNVAVNRDGVVGVLWYDRRAHSDNIGWDARMTASLDGGKTFLPGVNVSEKGMTFDSHAKWTALKAAASHPKDSVGGGISLDITMNTFSFLGGDTDGLVADAAGVFHPVWIDNRNGVPQVWTAPVRVSRTRTSAIAGDDVSARVTVDVSNARFDPASDSVTLVVSIRNTSTETLRGPFAVSLTKVDSDLATPVVSTNDWTFGDVSIAPGAASRPKTWRFALNDRQAFRNGNRYRLGLLKLHFSVVSIAGENHTTVR
jgi:hypothetical protein